MKIGIGCKKKPWMVLWLQEITLTTLNVYETVWPALWMLGHSKKFEYQLDMVIQSGAGNQKTKTHSVETVTVHADFFRVKGGNYHAAT